MRKKELTIYPDEIIVTKEPDQKKWYAMKVARPNSMSTVVDKLKEIEIEVFSPFDVVYKKRKGKMTAVNKAILGSFVFCKATERMLVEMVNTPGLPLIFFYTHVTQKTENNRRVIISNDEMERFIAFVNAEALHPQLLTMEQAKEEMYGGKEIEFKIGIFKGHKAVVSAKRHHRQRVVVTLANCMALTIELPKKENR